MWIYRISCDSFSSIKMVDNWNIKKKNGPKIGFFRCFEKFYHYLFLKIIQNEN